MLQDVKKMLAMVTVGFFFAVILILFFVQIPQANLDLLKIVVMALLSGASMVLGYYFGSSDGSARKTELIGVTPPAPPVAIEEPPAPGAEAGFIRLPLLAALALTGLLFLAGCATTGTAPAANDTPQVIAGKSLLAVKSTIVTAAQATDGLCRVGTLKPDSCAQAKAAYELAKPAYDSAVDAYLLMVQGGDPAAFTTALQRVQGIAANLAQLTGGAR
ncbi:MAG: hypothetical protein M0T70_06660 [Geobacteraceae bacterium]|nr:hypothetical protein [Geobacteraceae bacterium]